jgi:hypothetical protein
MIISELDIKNYKSIFYTNSFLTVPLFVLFAWPYVAFGQLLYIKPMILFPGALLFSFPFMLTILHGYVTLILGSIHRHHYYEWLQTRPLTYGLLFHPVFTRTRFRLVIFAVSVIVFLTGWFI